MKEKKNNAVFGFKTSVMMPCRKALPDPTRSPSGEELGLATSDHLHTEIQPGTRHPQT
jgi:hypothetical protein